MNERNDVEMKSSLPINPIMQYYPIRSVSADHTAETARISCGFLMTTITKVKKEDTEIEPCLCWERQKLLP